MRSAGWRSTCLSWCPKSCWTRAAAPAVPVLFALKDRNKREFFLGFTHEEVVTDIVRGAINSWKQMPIYLYQIQTKERDEPALVAA